jgi:hypothetical protein
VKEEAIVTHWTRQGIHLVKIIKKRRKKNMENNMYKLVIEQPRYNKVELVFENLKDMFCFMEENMKHCEKETTFSFEKTINEGVGVEE